MIVKVLPISVVNEAVEFSVFLGMEATNSLKYIVNDFRTTRKVSSKING